MQGELVGRGKVGTLSKVGKTIGALHRLESRGHTESYQAAFGANAESGNEPKFMRKIGGIIRGMSCLEKANYLWKTGT